MNPTVTPDFNWYAAQSAKAKVSPRCPIAGSELCPRYYASRWLLGEENITTKISEADKKRLDKKWDQFAPVVREEEPSISRGDGKLADISNFCPEVCADTFGNFVTYLSWYADEIDRDLAHRKLQAEKAALADPRWTYSSFIPRHYTECREYSIFTEISSGKKTAARVVRIGLTPKLRWQVLVRDDFTCQYCGRRPPGISLEVDHKVSVANGGTDDIENLVTACSECNGGKGSKNAAPVGPARPQT